MTVSPLLRLLHYLSHRVTFTLICLGFATSVIGCTTSIILDQKGSEEIYELSQVNPKKVFLKLYAPCKHDCLLGRQSFLIFPVGKTKAPDLEQSLYNAFYEALVQVGYKPVFEDQPQLPRLFIQVSELSMNTFDYLITRKIVTNITLNVSTDRNITARNHNSIHHVREEFYRLPFSREVTFELRETVREATEKWNRTYS